MEHRNARRSVRGGPISHGLRFPLLGTCRLLAACCRTLITRDFVAVLKPASVSLSSATITGGYAILALVVVGVLLALPPQMSHPIWQTIA